MKVYVLNHYIGGTPMDGHTIGVYKNLNDAKKEFEKSFELFGYTKNDERIEIEQHKESEQLNENEQMNIITNWFIDDEDCDFWGGCEIQVIELK